jgi:ketosteroid isomerase-like protein
MSTAAQNEQIVRNFFTTLSSGDLEKLRPLWHPDGSWEVMVTGIPGAGTYSGRDKIIDEFLKPIRGMFVPGDPKVHIDTIIAQGDLVACETTTRGTFLDGRDYHNKYCWVLELRDGLVYRLREYMDSYYVSTMV